MARFANLSSSPDRVKGKLQAALYYAREKTREARKEANAPLSFSGAQIGVVGSGGALPTGWVNLVGSFSLEVVGLEKRNGHDSIILRLFGLNSTGGTRFPSVTVQDLPAEPTQVFRATMLADIIDITHPFVQAPRNGIKSMNTNTVITGSYVNMPQDWSNYTVSHTIASGSNRARLSIFENSILDGAQCDVTIQLAMIKFGRIA